MPATKHRYPSHILNVIKTTTVMKMVDGDFGALPQKGITTTTRSGDGGFYARVQRWVTKTYGHRIGQGHLYKLKAEALMVTNRKGPARVTKPPVTVTESIKIKRLNLAATREEMTNKEIATSASIRAYSEHAPITVKQRELLNGMYQRIYIGRCKG